MTKKKKLPSPRVLRRLVAYNPSTGAMTWKLRPAWLFPKGNRGRSALAKMWNKKFGGEPAFAYTTVNGYKMSSIFNVKLLGHRVAWAIHFGRWPTGEIDHINGDRADNRISNLRDVTTRENSLNRRVCSNNTSGQMGVTKTRSGYWNAKIMVHGVEINLGNSKSYEIAVSRRKAAEIKYGFHPNHGRS